MIRRTTRESVVRRSGRRTAGLLLAALLGALVPVAAALVTAPAVHAATCGPAPAGQVAVLVVIDTGAGAGPAQHCVVRPERDTGMDALRATGLHVREDGGFICGIGGLPATGCARNQSPDVDSWWYWHGTPGGSWTYSSVGAPWYRLPKRCAVEGWRYGSPQGGRDVRIAPPAMACELPAPRPPATAAPARPAPPDAPSAGAGGAEGPTPGGRAPTGPPSSRGVDRGPGEEPETPSETTTPADAASTTSAVSPASTDRDGGSDPDPEVEADRADRDEGASPAGADLGLQTAEEAASAGGGSWVGAGVVLALLAVVGGGAVLRNRRR